MAEVGARQLLAKRKARRTVEERLNQCVQQLQLKMIKDGARRAVDAVMKMMELAETAMHGVAEAKDVDLLQRGSAKHHHHGGNLRKHHVTLMEATKGITHLTTSGRMHHLGPEPVVTTSRTEAKTKMLEKEALGVILLARHLGVPGVELVGA